MKQTSVEWLAENAEDFFGGLLAPSIIEQAKQMDKEQKNQLPIHIHEGVENVWVYIEDGIVNVKHYDEFNVDKAKEGLNFAAVQTLKILMHNKQTAVEWLVQEINKLTGLNVRMDEPCVEQAKQMDKEQKMDAYEWGRADEKNKQEDIVAPEYDNAEEFYEGQYGGNK